LIAGQYLLFSHQRRHWGPSRTDEYGGLRPGSKLVTTHKGQAFELAFKQRELDSGPEFYRACDSLQRLDHSKPYLTFDQATKRRAYLLAL
jgi:hypothetical protein